MTALFSDNVLRVLQYSTISNVAVFHGNCKTEFGFVFAFSKTGSLKVYWILVDVLAQFSGKLMATTHDKSPNHQQRSALNLPALILAGGCAAGAIALLATNPSDSAYQDYAAQRLPQELKKDVVNWKRISKSARYFRSLAMIYAVPSSPVLISSVEEPSN